MGVESDVGVDLMQDHVAALGGQSASDSPIMEANEVSIAFPSNAGLVEVVRSATFELRRGETLGLVGESGSGKTVTSLALMGLIRAVGGQITGGTIRFDGTDVTALPEKGWQSIRGNRISMIFQQPMRALNPAFTVGNQVAESVRRHRGASRKDAWTRAVELFDRVGIPDASARAHDYPHQFSGGMCQRVLIAMALACEPQVLIADEPTTALDVTVQARILDLLREIIADTGVSVLYITHDLGVVAQICDRIAVMYAGEVVESGPLDEVFAVPSHPYTEGLIRALPRSATGGRFLSIPGQVPPPQLVPAGCRFHPRCDYVVDGSCTSGVLPLLSIARRATRCARHDELELRGIESEGASS
jgi:peptide/nickel transport system ATP-binding protein